MKDFNRLILHPDFRKTIDELADNRIFLPPSGEEHDLPHLNFSQNGGLTTNLEDIKGYNLNVKNGCRQKDKLRFSAYDESIMKFSALEGSAYFTSHSLVVVGSKQYVPVNLVTFYFYTRSQNILSKSKYIKFAFDPEVEAQRDCIIDRINFLVKYAPPRSLLFIDGALIAGDLYTYMISSIDKFLQKEIIPIFFVKNSRSNLVTKNIKQLKNEE